MDTKQMLELAARAAGYDIEEYKGSFVLVERDGDSVWRTGEYWAPLEDDGDALRLAVKLDIEFYQGDDDGPAFYAGYWGKRERRDVTRMYCIEPLGDDPCAAARLAIVRAAAAIGEKGNG